MASVTNPNATNWWEGLDPALQSQMMRYQEQYSPTRTRAGDEDRNTVMRWSFDALRNNPQADPMQTVREQLARMRRLYEYGWRQGGGTWRQAGWDFDRAGGLPAQRLDAHAAASGGNMAINPAQTPGIGGGGTTTGMGYGTGAGRGFGGFTDARDIQSPEGQAALLRLMMERAGVNPQSLSSVARRLRSRLGKVIPTVQNLAELTTPFDPNNPAAFTAGLPATFERLAQALQGPAGSFYGALGGIGTQAMQPGAVWAGLSPEDAAQVMQGALELQTLGANPLLAQSMGTQMELGLDPLLDATFWDTGTAHTGQTLYDQLRQRLPGLMGVR